MTIDPTKEPLLPPSYSQELEEIKYPSKNKRQKVKLSRQDPSTSKVNSFSPHWLLQQPILENLTYYLDLVSIKRFQLASPQFYKTLQTFFDQAFKEKNTLFLQVSKAAGANSLPAIFSPQDLLKKTIDIKISKSSKGFSTKRSGMHDLKTITIGPVIKVKHYNKMNNSSIKTKSIPNAGIFSENHLFKFENHLAIFHEKNSRLIKILNTQTEEVTQVVLLDDEQIKQSLPLLNRNEQTLRNKIRDLNLRPLNLHAIDVSAEDLYETYKKYKKNIETLEKAIKEAKEELPSLLDTVIPLNALDWDDEQIKQSLPLLNRYEQTLRNKIRDLNLRPLNLHAIDVSAEDLHETYKKYKENIETLEKAIKEAKEELPSLLDTMIPLNALDWDDEQIKQSLSLLNRYEQTLRDKIRDLNLRPLYLHAIDVSAEDQHKTYKKYNENIETLEKAIKEAKEELPYLQDAVIPLNGNLIALDWEEKFALVQCSTRIMKYDLNNPANNHVFQTHVDFKDPQSDKPAFQTEGLLIQTYFSKKFLISCVKPCLINKIAKIQGEIKNAVESFKCIEGRQHQANAYIKDHQVGKACTELIINGRDLRNLQISLEDIFNSIEGHWRSLTEAEKQHLADFNTALTQYELDIKESNLFDENSNLSPALFISSQKNTLNALVNKSKFIINFLNKTSHYYSQKLENLPSEYAVISFDTGKQMNTFKIPENEEFLTAKNEVYFTFKRNKSEDTYTIFAKSLLDNTLLHSYTFKSEFYYIDHEYEKILFVNDQHLVMQIRSRENSDSDFYAFHLDQTHNDKPEHFLYKRVHQAYITDKELVIAHDIPRDTFSFWQCERTVITFKSRILEKK
ncbi:MAG: hypothetical protein BGO14_01650 [Chlamydiales bacterium 38-26]|nr:hypothetical protein [Chlamydiales bacterium]OJV08152.1 MAG: hypothetical protein BGO14_01650 [Chlamydiales bacterium 38-26]